MRTLIWGAGAIGGTVQNLGVKVPLAAIASRRPATSTADSGCREKFVSGADAPLQLFKRIACRVQTSRDPQEFVRL
jgi:hypothetical protein